METLTYMNFPTEHWTRIRTNNKLEKLNKEIKRRTKVVRAFPDGQSAHFPARTGKCLASLTGNAQPGIWQPSG